MSDPRFGSGKLRQQSSQFGIAGPQPAAGRDPVGFVAEFFRPDLVEITQGFRLEDLSMQGGDPLIENEP